MGLPSRPVALHQFSAHRHRRSNLSRRAGHTACQMIQLWMLIMCPDRNEPTVVGRLDNGWGLMISWGYDIIQDVGDYDVFVLFDGS